MACDTHVIAESFMGAAQMFFARQKPAKCEVLISDINGKLVTPFRVLKYHKDAFLRCLNMVRSDDPQF